MADYTQTTFFGPKDALVSGDPDKTILGVEVDPELSAVSAAIATKVDQSTTIIAGQGISGGANLSSDVTLTLNFGELPAAVPGNTDIMAYRLNGSETYRRTTFADVMSGNTATEGQAGALRIGTQAEVDAGISDDRIVTPLKLSVFTADSAGLVPNSRLVIAGTGIGGGGDLSGDVTLNLNFGELTEDVDPGSDSFLAIRYNGSETYRKTTLADAIADVPATVSNKGSIELATSTEVGVGTDTERAVTPSTLTSKLTGFVPTSRTVTGSGGLSGGGSLASNQALSLQVDTLADQTPVGTDVIPFASGTDQRSCTVTELTEVLSPGTKQYWETRVLGSPGTFSDISSTGWDVVSGEVYFLSGFFFLDAATGGGGAALRMNGVAGTLGGSALSDTNNAGTPVDVVGGYDATATANRINALTSAQLNYVHFKGIFKPSASGTVDLQATALSGVGSTTLTTIVSELVKVS